MPLEDMTGPDKLLDALNVAWPLGGDVPSEGDDHLRGIKNVLRNWAGDLSEINLTDVVPGNGNTASWTLGATTGEAPIHLTSPDNRGYAFNISNTSQARSFSLFYDDEGVIDAERFCEFQTNGTSFGYDYVESAWYLNGRQFEQRNIENSVEGTPFQLMSNTIGNNIMGLLSGPIKTFAMQAHNNAGVPITGQDLNYNQDEERWGIGALAVLLGDLVQSVGSNHITLKTGPDVGQSLLIQWGISGAFSGANSEVSVTYPLPYGEVPNVFCIPNGLFAGTTSAVICHALGGLTSCTLQSRALTFNTVGPWAGAGQWLAIGQPA